MRVGIRGSWRDKDRKAWDLLSNFSSFKDARYQLGAAIARGGAALTVGSDAEFTADKYAVEGYLSGHSETLPVRVVRPRGRTYPFPVYTKNSDSGILVVQSAKDRMRYDASPVMNRA